MENENMVRQCGNDFKYCDGNCVNCEVNRYTYTNNTKTENE